MIIFPLVSNRTGLFIFENIFKTIKLDKVYMYCT